MGERGNAEHVDERDDRDHGDGRQRKAGIAIEVA
jgi:hypothetical protein